MGRIEYLQPSTLPTQDLVKAARWYVDEVGRLVEARQFQEAARAAELLHALLRVAWIYDDRVSRSPLRMEYPNGLQLNACEARYQDIFQCQRRVGHEGKHVHIAPDDGRRVDW